MRGTDDIRIVLESVFDRIHRERMADVPILNPALSVEALGFEIVDDALLGVLITPWFMNLMWLPRDESDWPNQVDGTTATLELPAGTVEFIAGSEPGIGPYRMCSLFSPVMEFGDHKTAATTAQAVIDGLLRPEPEEAEPAKTPPPAMTRRELFRSLAGAK